MNNKRLRTFKSALKKSLLLTVVLLTACQVQNNNKPIDYVTDNTGQTAITFDEIYLNTERDFSIREEEGVEAFEREIIAQETTTRKAVIISSEALELKESYRNSSSSTGYMLDPLTEVQVFWPTNIANDRIEVLWTNDSGEDIRGWLLYIDTDGTKQINLIEDFVIEEVTLSGAKVITFKEEESDAESVNILIEAETNIVATEEIIEIEASQPEIHEEHKEEEPIPTIDHEDLGSTPEIPQLRPQARPDTDEETLEPEIDNTTQQIRPQARPEVEEEPERQDEVIESGDEDEATGNEPEVVVEFESADTIEPDLEHEHVHPDEETEEDSFSSATEFAPIKSLIPPTRSDDLVTVVTDEEFENIIDRLGLRRIQIPFSISTARSRIEAITRAERFSGCSFRPNIGNSNSGRDCYSDLILASDFVEFLKEHAHQCSVEAASAAFNRRPVLIQFSSNAGSINRPNSDTLHYRGRALDLFTATLYWSTNQEDKRTVRLHKNHTDGSSQTERENHEYYWSFVDCWRDKIRTFKPNSCGASRRGGALTYRFNSLHHNHIHLALPLSNTARRNHGLNCI